jgi:hypothetical protein
LYLVFISTFQQHWVWILPRYQESHLTWSRCSPWVKLKSPMTDTEAVGAQTAK